MYEYRHVILPKEIAKKVPKGRLLTEHEWRHLGVQQSLGKGSDRSISHIIIPLSLSRLGSFYDSRTRSVGFIRIVSSHCSARDFFLEPHILIFRRSLKVSQQVQQQRAAAAAAVAAQQQQQQLNSLHMK